MARNGRPWSFGLFGGKNGAKSVMAFFVILIIAIMTHIGGAVYGELQDRKQRPALALRSFLRDVREYVRTEKKLPDSMREIETAIWDKKTPGVPTRLNAPNILVADNYEYIYFAGEVDGIKQINVWALPLGKHRDEYDTVLLVIKTEGESIWKGPALSDEQREFILANGFNLSVPKMSQLNMKMDSPAKSQQRDSKNNSPF